jgi:hypothetical protein
MNEFSGQLSDFRPAIGLKVFYRKHQIEAVPFEDKFDLWLDGVEFMTAEYLPKCGTVFSVINAGRDAIDDAMSDGIIPFEPLEGEK